MIRLQADIETYDDQELIEAIASLDQTTLADDTVVCQVCNEAISLGEEVVCYLLCPSGATGYDLTQYRCSNHADTITELLTLGAHELIVDGRIGEYHDEQSGQSWLVLLIPRLRAVSAAPTTTARQIDADPYNRHELPAALTDNDPETTNQPDNNDPQINEQRHNDDPEIVDDDSNWQSATLSRWGDPTTEDDN